MYPGNRISLSHSTKPILYKPRALVVHEQKHNYLIIKPTTTKSKAYEISELPAELAKRILYEGEGSILADCFRISFLRLQPTFIRVIGHK